MLDKLTGKSVHLYIHLLSCALIAAGLPFSKIPLSLGTMLFILNLVLEADFRTYAQRLGHTRAAYGLWLFLIIELLSLLWTKDFGYGMHDLRVKLPLFAIPVALIAKPLTQLRHVYLILGLFLTALFTTSFINTGFYLHWWGHKVYDDIRGLSLFESHIRYALMIAMGFALSVSWIAFRLPYRGIAFFLAGWFLWYTWFSQIISGYVAVITVLLTGSIFLFRFIRRKQIRWAIAGTTLAGLVLIVATLIHVLSPVPHKMKIGNPDRYTVNGNWYRSDLNEVVWENGYPVVYYICETELEKEWDKRSSINYKTGKDLKNQPVYYTLWRYMSSKGLRKDSVGFQSMTATDIANVERGLASVELAKNGIFARLYSIQHQLEHPEDPNGHSMLQRLEYWKAARSIISANWITGVGSGDVQQAYKDYYAHSQTDLIPALQLRAHNQYMTSWVSSGIAGFTAFLLWWLLFLRFSWKRRLFTAFCFATIALGSFLIEDTLETQMGVTFVAFFFGLFASGEPAPSAKEHRSE